MALYNPETEHGPEYNLIQLVRYAINAGHKKTGRLFFDVF